VSEEEDLLEEISQGEEDEEKDVHGKTEEQKAQELLELQEWARQNGF
jgi:hypothetical protein